MIYRNRFSFAAVKAFIPSFCFLNEGTWSLLYNDRTKHCWNKLTEIFRTFFKIGLFTFGGGFAMIPLIEREIVDNHRWVSKKEFVDAISYTQSVPGALAINLAVFFGYSIAGLPGAFVAALGVAIPSIVVILTIAISFDKFIKNTLISNFFKGIRPAVVALILHAGLRLTRCISWTPFLIIIAVAVFVGNCLLGVSPMFIVAITVIAGIGISFIEPAVTKSGEESQNKEV